MSAATQSAATASWVSAGAAIGTLIVAVVAAAYAKRQLDGTRQAITRGTADANMTRKLQRELQTEQAQPYIAAFLDSSNPEKPYLVDFVVKNFGSTMATDVRIGSSPQMDRSPRPPRMPEKHPLELPDVIPSLAPGQEWRTFWDATHLRSKSDMAETYAITLEYSGIKRVRFRHQYRIDWGPFIIFHYVT